VVRRASAHSRDHHTDWGARSSYRITVAAYRLNWAALWSGFGLPRDASRPQRVWPAERSRDVKASLHLRKLPSPRVAILMMASRDQGFGWICSWRTKGPDLPDAGAAGWCSNHNPAPQAFAETFRCFASPIRPNLCGQPGGGRKRPSWALLARRHRGWWSRQVMQVLSPTFLAGCHR